MVHVTQENIALIDVDLIVTECLRANRGERAFAYLVSPFMSDFRIPRVLAKFSSNVIDVTDIQVFSDLIALLRRYGTTVNIATQSPVGLLETRLRRFFIRRQAELLSKLRSLGCEVRICPRLHAKATVTSQGAVTGSFNLTASGRFFNLEEGNYFPNVEGELRTRYDEKLKWAEDVFALESRPLDEQDLSLKVDEGG